MANLAMYLHTRYRETATQNPGRPVPVRNSARKEEKKVRNNTPHPKIAHKSH